MPYRVRVGDVRGNGEVYTGDVPDELVDDAMIDSGAVEWYEDPGTADITDASAEDAGPSESTAPETPSEDAAEAAPAASDPDWEKVDDIKVLRKAAKDAGINSFGKGKDELRELLKAKAGES